MSSAATANRLTPWGRLAEAARRRRHCPSDIDLDKAGTGYVIPGRYSSTCSRPQAGAVRPLVESATPVREPAPAGLQSR